MTRSIRTLCAAVALASLAFAPLAGQARQQDIVDAAVEAGSCTTLAKALAAAGLVETLKADGPFGERRHAAHRSQ